MRQGLPLAKLPDNVTFTLAEVADILFVVDVAVAQASPGSADHDATRAVQRLIASRLWPDLGNLLDDDAGRGE